MKIRLYNARILTMAEKEDIFKGEIHIENDKITYVGPSINAAGSFDLEKDCKGNLLMPGFKNAHTHSGMSVLRSLADDLPLDKWLNESIFPVEAGMTEDDIYETTKLSVLEYLTSGMTSCFDMYLTPKSVARAMADMGFRCVQVGAMNNFSQNVDLLRDMYENGNEKNSLNSYIIGFHAEYTTSKENIQAISDLANEKKAPVYTHLAETKGEVKDCFEKYGVSPMAFLDSVGMFNYGGGIYHGVHISKEDMEIMKKRNLCVVTNPGSNCKLASGIAPIADYIKMGIPVAIGTDGPASNNALDMFREMFLVSVLSKIKEEDAASLDAEEVLKMATVNGALAMGLTDCDILAEGKKADIILIDLTRPNMQPINNIKKNLVYSGSKENVAMTMINGVILYEDGEFKTQTSPEEIYKNVDIIKQRLIKN